MQYLYVLQCSGGHLYVGVTVDPRERIGAHQRGTACQFTEENPVERMVYIEPFQDEAEAEAVERQLVYDLEALRHPLVVAGGPRTGYEERGPPEGDAVAEAKARERELGKHPRAEVYRLARRPAPMAVP